MKKLEEKSTRFVISGKEYILKFRKSLFKNGEYVVELLKEKGKHELVCLGCLDIKEVEK
jgi:hypothetical protein